MNVKQNVFVFYFILFRKSQQNKMFLFLQFFNNLNDILILQIMFFSHSLWVMLDRGSPNQSP